MSVLPSAESVQIAEIILRPSFLRTTFQLFGPSTVIGQCGSVQGWLVSSVGYDRVDCAGDKGEGIFVCATASTFISSVSLLLDGFTFHLPTKGSFAAHNVPATRQTTSDERMYSHDRMLTAGAGPVRGNVVERTSVLPIGIPVHRSGNRKLYRALLYSCAQSIDYAFRRAG